MQPSWHAQSQPVERCASARLQPPAGICVRQVQASNLSIQHACAVTLVASQCQPQQPHCKGSALHAACRCCCCAGVDCSNLAAFVYNLAFGFYPTSDIGEIACHPSNAPGHLLPAVTTSRLDQLRPGDLVFITLGRKNRSPPVRVSHVVIWTGWTVDFSSSIGPLSKAALMANVADDEKGSIERCMAEKHAAGQPVYVIADRCANSGCNLAGRSKCVCGVRVSVAAHSMTLVERRYVSNSVRLSVCCCCVPPECMPLLCST